MKIHTEFSQLSEDWFAFKLGKFGASDAQAIANNGAVLTTLVYEKVAERLTGKAKEGYSNEAMLDGIEREANARNLYELEKGVSCQQAGLIELNDFVVASPDGLVGEDGLIEIKCPIISTHISYLLENDMPSDYYQQTQGQLLVTGRKWVDFVSYFPGLKPLVIRETPDDVFQKLLKKELELFTDELEELVKRLS